MGDGQQMLQGHDHFFEIIEGFIDPIVFLDAKLLVSYANRAFFEKFGLEQAQVVCNSFLALISCEDNLVSKQKLEEALESPGTVTRFELQFKSQSGGTLSLDVSAKCLENRINQPMLILSLNDITSRKEAEAERESLQAQLNQAQKMEAIGRLAGSVAHDFNNMLVVIIGHVEILAAKLHPDSQIHHELAPILMAAQRSADLTRQLLAFARKQVVAPQLIKLNQAVEGLLPMVKRLVGEDVELDWSPGQEVGSVLMDPSQFDQIVMNLCVNARDAIDGTGTIAIETGVKVLDQSFCANHVGVAPGSYALLSVRDNGCGMSPETMSRIFEPFFTTKESGKGTGLGLATVYGMVTQNNGLIDVQSEPTWGTTFTIYLPSKGTEPVPVAPAADEAAPRSGQETILLVEDETAVLTVTTQMLEGLGYRVLAARTPSEAVELALDRSAEIDLLITDVVLPEMNGRVLARNLMALKPDLKQLFISGYTANVIAQYGVADQGGAFLQKPFTRKELAAKVAAILSGQVP